MKSREKGALIGITIYLTMNWILGVFGNHYVNVYRFLCRINFSLDHMEMVIFGQYQLLIHYQKNVAVLENPPTPPLSIRMG